MVFQYQPCGSPLERVDPRIKILAFLGFVVVTVDSSWLTLAIRYGLLASLIGLTRSSIRLVIAPPLLYGLFGAWLLVQSWPWQPQSTHWWSTLVETSRADWQVLFWLALVQLLLATTPLLDIGQTAVWYLRWLPPRTRYRLGDWLMRGLRWLPDRLNSARNLAAKNRRIGLVASRRAGCLRRQPLALQARRLDLVPGAQALRGYRNPSTSRRLKITQSLLVLLVVIGLIFIRRPWG
jgi:energy-coupling factor transporter transmembrane protein EcfT